MHVRDGGRVVALIPTGPAADKKFDKWFYSEEERAIKPLDDHQRLGVIYKGDTLESNVSWVSGLKISKVDSAGHWYAKNAAGGETIIAPLSVTGIKPTGQRTKIFRPAENLYLVADIKMPQVTFERAGTQVATRIVVIEKQIDKTKSWDTRGVYNRDLSGETDINALFDELEDFTLPDRIATEAKVIQDAAVKAEKIKTQSTGGMFKLAETKHAIKKIDLFVASITKFVARPEYDRLNGIAKKHGGYYSKFKVNGAIPGFQFESAKERQDFLDEVEPKAPEAAGDVKFSKRDPQLQTLKAKAINARDAFIERDKQNHIDDPDEYFRLTGYWSDARVELADSIAELPDDGFSLRGETSAGRLLLLNKSTKGDGWQLTRFADDGMPWGDSQYNTKKEAVREFLHEAQLETVTDYDQQFSQSTTTVTNAHTKATLQSAQDELFGAGFSKRLEATGKVRYITRDQLPVEISGDAAFSKRKYVSDGRIQRTLKELVAYAVSQSSWKTWYQRHEDTLINVFGDDADLFQKILSATSQATGVKGNVTLALKAYDQLLSGQEFTGYLPAVIHNLNRIRNDEKLRGAKISQYGEANEGNVDAIAVDRHIAMLFFNTKTPNRAQILAAKKRINQIAIELGWEPRQVQAALWAYNQVRLGTDPEKVQSYDKILEARRDTINALRSKHGRGEGRGDGADGYAGSETEREENVAGRDEEGVFADTDILRSADGSRVLAYVVNGEVTFVVDNISQDDNVKGLTLHELGLNPAMRR